VTLKKLIRASSITLVLDQLHKENPHAYELFKYLAIKHQNVPEQVLQRLYLENINSDELRFAKALTLLRRLSLIKTDTKQPKGEAVVSCSDRVFKTLKEQLNKRELRSILDRAIDTCDRMFPQKGLTYFILTNDISTLEYLNAIARAGAKDKLSGKLDSLLLKLFERALVGDRNYKVAHDFSELLKAFYRRNKSNTINKARYHTLVGTYTTWNYANRHASIKALGEYKKALGILKNYPKAGEPRTYALLLMAQTYCHVGEIEQAALYATQAKREFSALKAPLIDRKDQLKFTMAQIYANKGDYTKALKEIKCNRLSVLENNGKMEPYHITFIVLYAKILGRLGRDKEAYDILKKLFRDFDKIAITKKYNTYVTLCLRLADVSCSLKKLAEMHSYLNEAKSMSRRIYKDKGRNHAELYKLEGDYYYAIKDYRLAKVSYSKSKRIYSKIFTNLNHDDVRRLLAQKDATYGKLANLTHTPIT
jgi:tetratricopeptide (TPR) repeat protein